MKKKFIYSLSVAVLLAFSGCGTSDNTTEVDQDSDIVSSGYSVIVERGAVLDANVTDANGSVAIQVSDDNNTYVFENEPVYPVTAEGGWIDVDGDGNLTQNDVALDINLTSYSNVITPTTTYIADENETVRQERLQQLAHETNCTTDDLLLPPSEASKNSIVVLNAVYEKLIEKNNENSKATLAIDAILQRYIEIDNNTNFDENATSKEIALAVEEQTMLNLQGNGLIKRFDIDDIKELKSKKPKKLKDMLEEGYESTENDDSESGEYEYEHEIYNDHEEGYESTKDDDSESEEYEHENYNEVEEESSLSEDSNQSVNSFYKDLEDDDEDDEDEEDDQDNEDEENDDDVS